MEPIKSSWVVEPTVPKEVRADYAIVAAQHVRAQEPLLLAGFTFGVPCAMLMGESLPVLLRFGLPTAIFVLCLLGVVFRPRLPTTEREATRSLTMATARTGASLRSDRCGRSSRGKARTKPHASDSRSSWRWA